VAMHLVITNFPNFWPDYCILICIHVGSWQSWLSGMGTLSLPFVFKVMMVWYFVSGTLTVMTAISFSSYFVLIWWMQLHWYSTLSFVLVSPTSFLVFYKIQFCS
jgi:hypothetical protein